MQILTYISCSIANKNVCAYITLLFKAILAVSRYVRWITRNYNTCVGNEQV